MSARLLALKAAFGGKIFGRTLLCPTIGHRSEDRGTSYTEDFSAPGNLLVKVHNGNGLDDDLAAKDRALEVLGERDDYKNREPDPIEEMRRQELQRRAEERQKANDAWRRRRALEAWRAARDPRGTPAEVYLRSRGLDLTDSLAGDVLRWHPAGPWEKGTSPMMIALMRDIVTNEPRAIHRTAITLEGVKIDRMMLGPAKGTAVKLGAPTGALVVGEGIETVLSAVRIGYGPGAWALGSAGPIGRLPVLDGIERLVLLEERDPTSANAVSDCGHRWTRAGRAVSVVTPKRGNDLNDALREVTA